MNIFIFDLDHTASARSYCDKHIVKQILEHTQMMACAVRVLELPDAIIPVNQKGKPYGWGYRNHPCARWMSESKDHLWWSVQLTLAMCHEFTRRFHKTHSCEANIALIHNYLERNGSYSLPESYVLAIKDEWMPHLVAAGIVSSPTDKRVDPNTAVAAYRFYMNHFKRHLAEWKYSSAPDWFDWGGVNLNPDKPTDHSWIATNRPSTNVPSDNSALDDFLLDCLELLPYE